MAVFPPPQDQIAPTNAPPPSSTRLGASGPRQRRLIGGFKPATEKKSKAGLIAVVAHLALGLLLLRAITFDTRFSDFFGFRQNEPAFERITYVETAPPDAPEEPPVETRPEPAARPPVDRGPVVGEGGGVPEPTVIVAPPRLVAPSDSSAVRRLSADEAAVVGVVPRADDRLWTIADLESLRREVREAAAGGGLGDGMPGARELDSVITWTLASAKDSLDSLAVVQSLGPRTADWTRTDSKGGRWGMDAGGIRLGKVTVPSALIGLLLGSIPSLSSNPIASERQRRLSLAQSDIARFRTSGPGNDQFKMLVQELRARRDRERAERRSQAKGPVIAPDDPQQR